MNDGFIGPGQSRILRNMGEVDLSINGCVHPACAMANGHNRETDQDDELKHTPLPSSFHEMASDLFGAVKNDPDDKCDPDKRGLPTRLPRKIASGQPRAALVVWCCDRFGVHTFTGVADEPAAKAVMAKHTAGLAELTEHEQIVAAAAKPGAP